MEELKTVGAILAEHFEKWKIKHVFGIPGRPIAPLLKEIDLRGIHYVLGRHETGSGYCAAGYAFNRNTLGIVIGTSGPGGTNLLTAAAQAKADNLPVLFITGQPPITQIGKPFSQDSSKFGIDLVKMFEPVTLFSCMATSGQQLELILKHALEKATQGPGGPIHLSIPLDVLLEEIPPFYVELSFNSSKLISSQLNTCKTLIEQAKQPVLFLGKGVHTSQCYEEVAVLAESYQIPVITTPSGKGTFVTNHPLYLGGYGLGGTQAALDYLKSGIDLMIVVGTRLSDMSLAGFTSSMYPKQILHFDLEPTFVGKAIPVPTTYIGGNMRENLKGINEMSTLKSVVEYSEIQNQVAATYCEEETDSSYILAEDAVKVIRKHLPSNTIIFGDAGSHSYYAIQHLEILEPGTFFFDDQFIAMGHAIGYAIGAKLSVTATPVACIVGDGCVFMHGNEISTAVNENIPVIFFVFNNHSLDMVDKGMTRWLNTSIGSKYSLGLDVSQFAKSFGAKAYCCKNKEEIELAIKAALITHNEPTVIEILVDPNEIPPTAKREE
ncbi:thiamine pyrophosphate-binding protein [Anaerobacillus isosaccharinicus]|uniref:Acetolactate synthase n=1 Tax=Anaerobacillus isosaccharinicus TaxID=1532552 RepID=A0A1S2L4K7_9BACI|nr:thiamine pyrophosphate-binding protein [Anaerobacillus isosaccharinicus]MBA5584501.1 thiamine pyrophosphate-binding protein [Anaerobacillus isosaccharinicus]QOY37115.1 thiamine pyrophosphate-binding protein [Anaerobacillus isosaccharinicus]